MARRGRGSRNRDLVRIKVEGLKEAQRATQQVSKDLARDMRKMTKNAAEPARDASRDATVKGPTGKLRRSVKIRATGRKAELVMGSPARVPYAPPIHWGWPRRNIASNPSLITGIVRSRDDVAAVYAEGLDDILRRADLI